MEQVSETHLIDTDAIPSYLRDKGIAYNDQRGMWRWNPEEVTISEIKIDSGHCEKPYGFTDLNAAVLWYLLDHKELIPEQWKRYQCIYFLGTRYRWGHEVVQYLTWVPHGKWCWDYISSEVRHLLGRS